MKLNLGCSDRHLPGYVNVDRVPPADQIVTLGEPRGLIGNPALPHTWVDWPWETNSVEDIIAHDIYEHLPSKIHTMNESWRILRPGGLLNLFVPTTDGRGAFQDPTHVSYWTPNDLLYYCREFAEWQRFHVAYSITACFDIVSHEHKEYPGKVWKLAAILRAIK